MSDSFGKKPEISPGGSVIHRYGEAAWSPNRTGSPDPSTAKFAETRHAVYAALFGEVREVFEEARPLIPRIEVRSYFRRGKDGSEVCSLVTSGMSDLRMKAPAGADALRTELILYCTEPKAEYVETMRWLAHVPHDQNTWIGYGHTIPNGDPPAPFWGSRILDTILLMPPIVAKDQALPDQLALDGDPVHFLWLAPLTTAECKLKLARGFEAILDLFQTNRHPHVFDPNRASYV